MMKLINQKTRTHMAVWVGCLALAGCFSDDDEAMSTAPVVSTQPVLTNALAGIPAGFVNNAFDLLRFQIALNTAPASAQDSAEPFDVSGTTLPSSETAEPFEV